MSITSLGRYISSKSREMCPPPLPDMTGRKKGSTMGIPVFEVGVVNGENAANIIVRRTNGWWFRYRGWAQRTVFGTSDTPHPPPPPPPPGVLLCSCGQNGLCCLNYGCKKNTLKDVSTPIVCAKSFYCFVSLFYIYSFRFSSAHSCSYLPSSHTAKQWWMSSVESEL